MRKHSFCHNLAESVTHWNFSIFSVTSKSFFNNDVNINPVNSAKSTKFNGFVLVLFFILGLGQKLSLENFQLCRLVVF